MGRKSPKEQHSRLWNEILCSSFQKAFHALGALVDGSVFFFLMNYSAYFPLQKNYLFFGYIFDDFIFSFFYKNANKKPEKGAVREGLKVPSWLNSFLSNEFSSFGSVCNCFQDHRQSRFFYWGIQGGVNVGCIDNLLRNEKPRSSQARSSFAVEWMSSHFVEAAKCVPLG